MRPGTSLAIQPFDTRFQIVPPRPQHGLALWYPIPQALSIALRTWQVRSVRAEVDRREAAGQFVAGRGGEGGANPMRSPEERVERQKLIVRPKMLTTLKPASQRHHG